MNKIKLTPRLQCVAEMVSPCEIVADIGTDHAYIPMYLVQNGVVKKAVASDVVDGPVAIARANVSDYCLDGYVKVTKAYGLKSAKGADVAVIAGMGGKLICDILAEDIDIARSIGTLVLQPMTCQYELRKFLHQNGFAIMRECLAKEEDKIYNVMTVSVGEQSFDDDFYYHIGKYLFESGDPLLAEYIHKKYEVLKKRIKGMKKSQNPDITAERESLEKLCERLEKEASGL